MFQCILFFSEQCFRRITSEQKHISKSSQRGSYGTFFQRCRNDLVSEREFVEMLATFGITELQAVKKYHDLSELSARKLNTLLEADKYHDSREINGKIYDDLRELNAKKYHDYPKEMIPASMNQEGFYRSGKMKEYPWYSRERRGLHPLLPKVCCATFQESLSVNSNIQSPSQKLSANKSIELFPKKTSRTINPRIFPQNGSMYEAMEFLRENSSTYVPALSPTIIYKSRVKYLFSDLGSSLESLNFLELSPEKSLRLSSLETSEMSEPDQIAHLQNTFNETLLNNKLNRRRRNSS